MTQEMGLHGHSIKAYSNASLEEIRDHIECPTADHIFKLGSGPVVRLLHQLKLLGLDANPRFANLFQHKDFAEVYGSTPFIDVAVTVSKRHNRPGDAGKKFTSVELQARLCAYLGFGLDAAPESKQEHESDARISLPCPEDFFPPLQAATPRAGTKFQASGTQERPASSHGYADPQLDGLKDHLEAVRVAATQKYLHASAKKRRRSSPAASRRGSTPQGVLLQSPRNHEDADGDLARPAKRSKLFRGAAYVAPSTTS